MAGSLDYEWSEMGVCVGGGAGREQGCQFQLRFSPHREYAVLMVQLAASFPLSPRLNVTLVQTTCLPSYRGWSLGGADDPRIGPDSPEPRDFSHFLRCLLGVS